MNLAHHTPIAQPAVLNPAPAEAAISEPLRHRWSPRAFSADPIPAADLRSLLEAARWAPSSMNEQPWAFIVADRSANPAAHARVLDTLVPVNASWARQAPVLLVVSARKTFANGRPNRHAWYDTGAAVANLSVEATIHGLVLHQMGGFDPAKAVELLGIPEGYEPVVVLALGHPGDPSTLAPELQAREAAPRRRRPVSEFTFDGNWGIPFEISSKEN